MVVSRLLSLEDFPDGLYVRVCWKGLDNKEDTLEPIARVSEDVPQLFGKLLKRKSKPADLSTKARPQLGL